MKAIKITLGIIIGIFITALCFFGCLITLAYKTENLVNYPPTIIIVILVYYISVYCIITGGVLGAVITAANIKTTKAALLGFFYYLFVGWRIMVYAGGVPTEFFYIYGFTLVIGAINGTVVSLLNLWKEPLK